MRYNSNRESAGMTKLKYTFKTDMLFKMLFIKYPELLKNEELEEIKAMGVPVMDQAISAYYTITASSEFRERERLYEKARHDEAQALHHAREVGEAEGMAKGLEQIREKWRGIIEPVLKIV
jgi:flagellar biosynthesis/type III secretory pathway protein FliH